MQSLLPDSRRSSRDRNTLFLMLILGLVLLQVWSTPNRQQQPQNADILDKKIEKGVDENKPAASEISAAAPIAVTTAEPTWITLGSMDSKSPYRMLVTLTNQGAAVSRIELNTSKSRDVQELSGYMGQIVVDSAASDKQGDGVTVQVVGHGTPAFRYGLTVGDKITQFDLKNKKTGTLEPTPIKQFDDLRNALLETKPGDHIDLTFQRNGATQSLTIILESYPIDVIRPESAPKNYEDYRHLGGLRGVVLAEGLATGISDQLSFLTSLQQVDDHELDLPVSLTVNNSSHRGMIPRDKTLDIELPGVSLRREPWDIVSSTENEAVFKRTIPAWNLEMVKTYRLMQIENRTTGAGYELTFKIELRNKDTKEHQVAYQLDGPTGLPLEGGWYARKTGPGWGMYGIRDIAVKFHHGGCNIISNNVINSDNVEKFWTDVDSLDYIGVDSLYFQCTMKPKKPEGEETWHVKSFPIRVGEKNYDWAMLTDVSFRLLSRTVTLQPEEKIEHEYSVFVGPKDTAVLAEHGLSGTLSYGWFWFVAQPLLGVLHFFHSLGMTYAMAIIALTICVRLIIFPLSIKQAMGAIKMQAIQPELKEIAEKYKDDLQLRSKAQSEVFKKHGYHPASGCLPLFIQLPIFIGLYKALQIDAGLYGTPLISTTFRWCSDLSAPDMLFDWSSFWTSIGWSSFNTGTGTSFFAMFALGPYFNLLPMLTIVLFLVQQAIMMPPPTDDQSRMQRKMMQYMMIFMGFLFFKIPSGLCIYFIVSTTWGLLERRFVPKAQPVSAANSTYDVTPTESKESKKKPKRNRDEKEPKKEPGFFGKMARDIVAKAAERQKLEKAKKKKK